MKYERFIFTDERVKITYTRETYYKTKSGKSWKRKPAVVTHDIVSPGFYTNYINSRYFFKSRVQYAYTPAGYLPVKLTTVSPFEDLKYIDTFNFEYEV